MTRQLLEGYVGVKYTAVCSSPERSAACVELHPLFRESGERLLAHDMTPANGGNMSQRHGSGFVITASGCNLGRIAEDELVLVVRCSIEDERVEYTGPRQPSSEAIMHWLIYRDHPSALAVLHAHDELATSSPVAGDLPETPREEPYGTAALARLAAEVFARGHELIVLKNHGYVVIADDLARATEIVVRKHLELLERARVAP